MPDLYLLFLFTPNGADPPEVGGGSGSGGEGVACVETQAGMCGDKAVNLT